MSEYDLQLLKEFRSEVPAVDAVTVESALARIVPRDGSRKTLRRGAFQRNRRVAVGVVFAAFLLAAAAVAAVKEGPWWETGQPPVDPQAVAAVARDNMPANVRVADARTVATDDDAALVAVPLDQTGYCLIPTLEARASFGASCVFQVRNPQSGDADSAEILVRAKTDNAPGRWIAEGRITDPRAATLDLGAFKVALARGGFFLAQVPENQWSSLDGTANRGSILDSSGHLLRSGCVNWGSSPSAKQSDPSRPATILWVDQPSGACKPQTIPSPPMIDISQARKLFDVTLTEPYGIWKIGQRLSFEEAPASDGTTCAYANGPGLPPENFSHGCPGSTIGRPRPDRRPIDVGIGAGLAHADGEAFYAWEIMGSTDPTANIARLTLTSPSASAEVSYRDSFFFAQLPVTTPGPRVGSLPLPAGPWVLTGYDSSGNQVARIDLNERHRQSTPH